MTHCEKSNATQRSLLKGPNDEASKPTWAMHRKSRHWRPASMRFRARAMLTMGEAARATTPAALAETT